MTGKVLFMGQRCSILFQADILLLSTGRYVLYLSSESSDSGLDWSRQNSHVCMVQKEQVVIKLTDIFGLILGTVLY